MNDKNAQGPFSFYNVRGEPDPYILYDIFQLIPIELLPRAIQLALNIPFPDLGCRAATVSRLAGRFKEQDEDLIEMTLLGARRILLEKEEVEPSLLTTLVPLLPVHLVPIAIEMAVRIVNYDVRISILASLVKCFSVTDQKPVFISAMDAIGTVEFEYHKTEALIILIMNLPPSIELLKKAVSVAKTIKDRKMRLDALSALVHRFQGNEGLNDYIDDLQKRLIPDGKLAGLEEILPPGLKKSPVRPVNKDQVKENKRVLESMLRLPEFYLNIEYIVHLALKLPEKECAEMIPKLLATAGSIDSENTKFRTLIEVLILLPPEDRQKPVDEIVQFIPSVRSVKERAEFYSLLIPLLNEPMRKSILPEIVSLIKKIKDEISLTLILEDLIPFLPDGMMNDIMKIIDSLKTPRHRIRSLVKMAVYFDISRFHDQMERTLVSITATDDLERSYLLKIIAPCLPRDLLVKARQMSLKIRQRETQARAASVILANLARHKKGKRLSLIALKEAFYTGIYGGGRGGRSDAMNINIKGKRAKELLTGLPLKRRGNLIKEWLGPVVGIPENKKVVSKAGPGGRSESFTRQPGTGFKRAGIPVTRTRGETRSKGKEQKDHIDILTGSSKKVTPADRQIKLKERVVNTGFSERENASKSLKGIPLECGKSYYFWLDFDKHDSSSIEKTPIPVPVEHLPTDALLKVTLFNFEGEIEITEGADVGELKLLPDGSAMVNRQPGGQTELLPAGLAGNRLFFPVKAPLKNGISRLRCNIYYEQILVQARLIRAKIMLNPKPDKDALVSIVDYSLSHTLLPAHLTKLKPHRLSLMLNPDGNKTHALIFGQKEDTLFKEDAVLSSTELKTPVENARKALRKVSWGNPDPWSGQQYKYKHKNPDIKQLSKDIINLAISGYILYNALIDKLTGGRKRSYRLAELMLTPGMIQIALKQSPSQVIPAALFYDYPLDTQAAQHKLCDTFINALRKKEPLEGIPCFNGSCPNYDKLDYVCPGGFWGYRHFLGTPVSLDDQNGSRDVAPEIVIKGRTEFIAGVATNLDRLDEHMGKLKALSDNLGWHYSEHRTEIINLLRVIKSHIIYFYCHGEYGTNNTLFLQVGKGNEYIDGSILRANRIMWDDPGPLVFINGCHTTAVDPEQAINLVQDFVGSGGAGVIGTEITIFEPLACDFAEECLRLFLSGKSSIGEAVRSARLKLLKEGNPLGLVYIPFILPSLHIKI